MLRNLVRSCMLARSPCFLRTPRSLLCTMGPQQELQGKGKSMEDEVSGESGQTEEAAAIRSRGEEDQGDELISGTGQQQQLGGKGEHMVDELSGQTQEVAAIRGSSTEDEGLKQTKDDKNTVKLEILMTSYESPMYQCYEHLAREAKQIRLPETRVVHTVLRSPHIDKKSREQFEMRTKKQLLIIKTNSHELPKKYFWLKRMRIIGAQFEVRVSCKTKLDLRRCKAILEKSRAGL